MQRLVIIIYNAYAGSQKAKTYLFEILKALACQQYETLLLPVIPGEKIAYKEILTRYEDKANIVLCIGGDGSVHYLYSYLLNTQYKIFYIPTGSTNDFAKSLTCKKLTLSPAFLDLSTKKDFYVDAGRCNETLFCYTAAFGLFTEISWKTNQSLKNRFGRYAYFLYAARQFFSMLNFSTHLHIEYEGKSIDGEFIYGAVSNSISVGGFTFPCLAQTKLDDGRFEVLLIKKPSTKLGIFKVFFHLLRNIPDPHILSFTTKGITFSSDQKISWTCDGEQGEDLSLVTIEILKRAICFLR